MRGPWASAIVLLFASAAQAQDGFPKGHSFIIQLTSSQFASGLGEYLVPPLTEGFRKAGLRYEGGPGAEYVATVESGSDVGRWYDTDQGKVWLYEQTVTVGLSPADHEVEVSGELRPAFAAEAIILTDNADRDDQLDCLIRLAVRTVARDYQPKGLVRVNGASCER